MKGLLEDGNKGSQEADLAKETLIGRKVYILGHSEFLLRVNEVLSNYGMRTILIKRKVEKGENVSGIKQFVIGFQPDLIITDAYAYHVFREESTAMTQRVVLLSDEPVTGKNFNGFISTCIHIHEGAYDPSNSQGLVQSLVFEIKKWDKLQQLQADMSDMEELSEEWNR